MHSVKIDAFFSCSFRNEDKDINDWYVAICRALDIEPTNVSSGSSKTPPEEAKRQISEAQALVAICTCRDELKAGGFSMPQAVQDEISFAFGIGTPVLIFAEEGVKLEGFKANFSTYQTFTRPDLTKPAFMEKAVRAIHKLKLDVLGPHQIGTAEGITDAIAEYVFHCVELSACGESYEWQYSTSKKLIFQHDSKRRFPAHVWAVNSVNLPEDSPQISWNFQLKSSSNNISIDDEIEEQTQKVLKVSLKPTPHPQKDDYIEFTHSSRSRYLNSVWKDEVGESQKEHLDDKDYDCIDGFIFIHRTKKAILEFRFDRSYPISLNNIRSFVASYTSGIDYEVPTEIERANIRIEDFVGTKIVRMEISSPLPGHMYGIAWDAPVRPSTPEGVTSVIP